ncbi:MAG TPA: cytidylate kinase-like family protein [Candidatus Angelobacter sp.]|jgi:cytidylate kinase|nr:cytidylate kinase-like family protein [Candidatus Angelobacter sp.]
MIRIITIEREYGCGAPEIARSVASELGWKLWDQKLTSEIARMANCHVSAVEEREERTDSLYHRLLKSFARGSYEASMTVDPPHLEMLQSLDADAIVRISRKVVEQAAAEGNCVIVGRGSQHFLQAQEDTMRFFLYAPRGDKIERLIAEGAKEGHAASLIDSVDRDRAAFIKNYFNAEWPNRQVYHAMFNTATGHDTVVRAILGFVKIAPAKAA